MDAYQIGRLLRTTAAGSMMLMPSGIVLAEHLVQFEPDRPQVSAAITPIWGYNRPCWRRFPEVPPCDFNGCLSSAGYTEVMPSQSIYVPQPTGTSKPVSVLPGDLNTGRNPSPPALNGTAPAAVIPPAAGAAPMQPVIPSLDRPLPPLPSPPGSALPPGSTSPLTPVPDPGAQQSRYSPSSIWTPQNSGQTSRYGQIPVSPISNRVVIPGSAGQIPPLRRTP